MTKIQKQLSLKTTIANYARKYLKFKDKCRQSNQDSTCYVNEPDETCIGFYELLEYEEMKSKSLKHDDKVLNLYKKDFIIKEISEVKSEIISLRKEIRYIGTGIIISVLIFMDFIQSTF